MAKSFQARVHDWMTATFSMEICRDTTERCHRFTEESLELVQAEDRGLLNSAYELGWNDQCDVVSACLV